MKRGLPNNVINPFSENFLEWWDKWKQFKKDVFNFNYKGVMSEQAKLIYLSEISGGDEETAKQIILRSIGEQWKGLFPLPDNYKKQATNGGKQTTGGHTREGVNKEFDRRDYEKWSG